MECPTKTTFSSTPKEFNKSFIILEMSVRVPLHKNEN